MKQIFILGVFCFLLACQSTEAPTGSAQTQTQPPKITASPVDGVYVFDSHRYKEEQLKHSNNVFKDVPSQDIDQVMKVFAPFQIRIDRGTATASFSNEVIRGAIKELSRTSQEIRLRMNSINEEHKNELLTLIITGDRLVMDPGKEETDKMYYRRAGSL